MTFKEALTEGLRRTGAPEAAVQQALKNHALFIAQNDKPMTEAEAKVLVDALLNLFELGIALGPDGRRATQATWEAERKERDARN